MAGNEHFSELKAPTMKISDIIIDGGDIKDQPTKDTVPASTTLGDPSLILGDWLFLGNRHHAKSREILEKLQITHVLNITATLPNRYPDIIQYAQIKAFDDANVKLYEYFEAAVNYIDTCNPLNYNTKTNKKRKILVHCAMGISRSSTITMSYLMSRKFIVNNREMKILNHIQTKLELFDQEVEKLLRESDYTGKRWTTQIYKRHENNNKDLTKRNRIKYQKVNDNIPSALPLTSINDDEKMVMGINDDDIKNDDGVNTMIIKQQICNGLTLSESYSFVHDRRNVIFPNLGFCRQLESWEKLVWSTNNSTFYQISFFRPDLQLTDVIDFNYNPFNAKKEKKNDHSTCKPKCCIIL